MCTLEIRGDLDIAISGLLRQELDELLALGVGRLDVDLSGVVFMDSSAASFGLAYATATVYLPYVRCVFDVVGGSVAACAALYVSGRVLSRDALMESAISSTFGSPP